MPKARQPSAPASAGVQQIPFLPQATAAQLQSSALDDDVTPSPVKSASSVKVGNGSPDTESLLAAQSPHLEQAPTSDTQVDSPEGFVGKAVANNGEMRDVQESSEDEPKAASPHSPDASLAATATLKVDAIATSANETPIIQESPSPTFDVVVAGQTTGPSSDSVEDPQGSSSRSQLAQPADIVSAPESPVRHAIPFASHTTAQQPTAAVPAQHTQPDEHSSQADTAAALQGAASLPQPAASSSSGRHALQPQASLSGDSHARAAAVAEAIKRAAQAIEPEQTAMQGVANASALLVLRKHTLFALQEASLR